MCADLWLGSDRDQKSETIQETSIYVETLGMMNLWGGEQEWYMCRGYNSAVCQVCQLHTSASSKYTACEWRNERPTPVCWTPADRARCILDASCMRVVCNIDACYMCRLRSASYRINFPNSSSSGVALDASYMLISNDKTALVHFWNKIISKKFMCQAPHFKRRRSRFFMTLWTSKDPCQESQEILSPVRRCHASKARVSQDKSM